MISVAPGTLARRVLEHVVALPGELGADDLAALLWPEPRHEGPFTRESYAAHLAALRAHRDEDASAARVRRVSGLLHRLQQQGLLERCDGVRVAEWFVTVAHRRGVFEALRLARVEPDDEEQRGRGFEGHVLLLAAVEEAQGMKVREIRRGGWAAECYADLCAWGVLVPPTHRTATEKGRALVEGPC